MLAGTLEVVARLLGGIVGGLPLPRTHRNPPGVHNGRVRETPGALRCPGITICIVFGVGAAGGGR